MILPARESLVSQQHPLKHQKLSPVTEMHCVTSFVQEKHIESLLD